MKLSIILIKPLAILLFTLLGFVVMGYHPGVEDDGVYLSAVKADLQPDLYPHDSQFFRLQTQATVFDRWIAGFVRTTGISIPWAELLWQLLSLYGILWASHSIARQLFPEETAQWAGVAMVAAMFTLPVAGTALCLADQHLHPRNLATAFILMAIGRILSRRTVHAVLLLMVSLVVHPIMAAMGMSFCFFLWMALMKPTPSWLRPVWQGASGLRPGRSSVAAAVPLGWIFEPPSPTWHRALETRRYFFLSEWTWYEWLGALGPLVLFWLLWHIARTRGKPMLGRFALGVLLYGAFQQAVAIILFGPSILVRLTPLQPMRYLHLIYLLMALMAGCLLGKYGLRTSVWRWTVFLLAMNGAMFATQRMQFSASEHLEMPWRRSNNPWLQAFAWIRGNTPVSAYLALDPNYLAAPGEDYHSFRALAERSHLADALKDAAVVTQVPELGPEWAKEVDAQSGWSQFQTKDFKRLNTEFGVGWVLVTYPQPEGLNCEWHNEYLSVCAISRFAVRQ